MYYNACMAEAFNPGSFQSAFNKVCIKNNYAVLDYDTPDIEILKQIVPEYVPKQVTRNDTRIIAQDPRSSHPTTPSSRDPRVNREEYIPARTSSVSRLDRQDSNVSNISNRSIQTDSRRSSISEHPDVNNRASGAITRNTTNKQVSNNSSDNHNNSPKNLRSLSSKFSNKAIFNVNYCRRLTTIRPIDIQMSAKIQKSLGIKTRDHMKASDLHRHLLSKKFQIQENRELDVHERVTPEILEYMAGHPTLNSLKFKVDIFQLVNSRT